MAIVFSQIQIKPKERARQASGKGWMWLFLALLAVSLPLGAAYFVKDRLPGLLPESLSFSLPGMEPSIERAVEGNAGIIKVPKGGDLQKAINMAQPGDTIVLEAGATYTGAFTLPVKSGNQYITIQSSALNQLPEGKRVDPALAKHMPKIVSAKGRSAFTLEPKAHHYKLIGLEISPGSADYVYNLVDLGTAAEKVADVPHSTEIDRCFLHPFKTGTTRRGIALNSANTVVKNSYLQGFAFPGEETQAICGWTGTKNVKVLNNYLEGGAENIMFGGSDPKSADLIPTDVEVRGNWLRKPEDWKARGASMKTLFELKNVKRAQVIGNLMENAPDGEAMRITIRNQDGGAPFSTIEDVVIKNNVVKNATNGLLFLGMDNNYPSQRMKRVKVVNNLFLDFQSHFMTITDGEDIEISHNTVFHKGNIVSAYGVPVRRFIFRDNIIGYNEYGLFGENVGVGARVAAKYFPDGTFRSNAIVNNRGMSSGAMSLPGGNFEIKGFESVGFVSYAGKDFRLAPGSKLKNKALDKTDVGCDINALLADLPKDLHARLQQ